MNTLGATTIGTMPAPSLKPYFFGRFRDFGLSGAAAFFRSRRKSLRLGIGISSPFGVNWVFFMAHPLDGARLKVVRAQEHMESLKAEIAMYMQGRPWEIRMKKHVDKSGIAPMPFEIPELIVTTPPPLRLSTVIGACVTNLRAAVDYILWELVAKYFNPPFNPLDSNDRRITAFPISEKSTHRGYMDRLDRLAQRKIPAAADRKS